MSAPKPFTNNSDLPAGGHVMRNGGLVWRRRVDWTPSDYRFICEQYRKLAASYDDVAEAVESEREHRFGREQTP